ncbi:MAG: T9SS type A sorting domain-containing protein, partial [Bacteroidota bacterium]
EMLISPNPVKDMLTIEWGNHATSQIRIFDLQGRLIWEIQPSSLSQHKLQLSIQSWKAGVYGVQVLGQQGASTHQFIVLSD